MQQHWYVQKLLSQEHIWHAANRCSQNWNERDHASKNSNKQKYVKTHSGEITLFTTLVQSKTDTVCAPLGKNKLVSIKELSQNWTAVIFMNDAVYLTTASKLKRFAFNKSIGKLCTKSYKIVHEIKQMRHTWNNLQASEELRFHTNTPNASLTDHMPSPPLMQEK